MTLDQMACKKKKILKQNMLYGIKTISQNKIEM